MRARSIISCLLLAFLNLSFTPSQSAPPPKAGSICQKSGSSKTNQGIKYTCIKDGKKLVWKRVKESTKESVKTKPRYLEALEVQKQIDKALVTELSAQPRVNWYFQSNLSSQVIDDTKLGLEKAIIFFSRLGFATNDAFVFVADNEKSLRSLIGKAGCSLTQYLPAMGFISGDSCPDGRFVIAAQSYPSLKLGTGIKEFEFQHILAHEYAHQLQFELIGNNTAQVPTWMIEGGAQFLSSVAFYSWNSDSNYEDHLFYITTLWRWDSWTSCTKVRVQDVPRRGQFEELKCGYSKGAKAVEFLVAKYGFSGYREILRNSSNKTFETAFQDTTGDSLESFYKELEVFLKSQGWG
ncbi:MAG: hypothetical protein RL239_290 [Actinomycetota bacterium]|jgi:hypothetical protein